MKKKCSQEGEKYGQDIPWYMEYTNGIFQDGIFQDIPLKYGQDIPCMSMFQDKQSFADSKN